MIKKPEKLVYLAADHGGFVMKEKLITFLLSKNFTVVDAGAFTKDKNDDYPKYAEKVALEVRQNNKSLGILLCRSGQGMCVAANKISGIRAALAWNEKSAKHSRRDDHANILCLAADYFTLPELQKMAWAWLSAKPSVSSRHRRRVQEISKLEKGSHA